MTLAILMYRCIIISTVSMFCSGMKVRIYNVYILLQYASQFVQVQTSFIKQLTKFIHMAALAVVDSSFWPAKLRSPHQFFQNEK